MTALSFMFEGMAHSTRSWLLHALLGELQLSHPGGWHVKHVMSRCCPGMSLRDAGRR
jgi:hypothetical protein